MTDTKVRIYFDAAPGVREVGDQLIAAAIKHESGSNQRATEKAMKARARLSGFLLCFFLEQGHQVGVDATDQLAGVLMEDYRRRHSIKRPTPDTWAVGIRQGSESESRVVNTWEKGEAAEQDVIRQAIEAEFAPTYGYGYRSVLETRVCNGYTEVGLKLPGDQVHWTGRTYHANLVERGVNGVDTPHL